MLFTCHAIVDGTQIVKWVIRGEGRSYKGVFIDALKGRVLLEHPDAKFEDSTDIPWGQEALGG